VTRQEATKAVAEAAELLLRALAPWGCFTARVDDARKDLRRSLVALAALPEDEPAPRVAALEDVLSGLIDYCDRQGVLPVPAPLVRARAMLGRAPAPSAPTTAREPISPADELADPMCRCGHTRDEHFDTVSKTDHRQPCGEPCGCRDFTSRPPYAPPADEGTDE
jgi:hypothetical protein